GGVGCPPRAPDPSSPGPDIAPLSVRPPRRRGLACLLSFGEGSTDGRSCRFAAEEVRLATLSVSPGCRTGRHHPAGTGRGLSSLLSTARPASVPRRGVPAHGPLRSR